MLCEVFRPSVEPSRRFIGGFLVLVSLKASTLGKNGSHPYFFHPSLSDGPSFAPLCAGYVHASFSAWAYVKTKNLGSTDDH